MQTVFDFVMQHPFWALYLAILLGIALLVFITKKQKTRPGVPGVDKKLKI